MVQFVNAISSPATFSIPIASVVPVSGISWTFTGLPAIPNSGVSYYTSDDTSITFQASPGFVNPLSSMTVRAAVDDGTSATATFSISSGSSAVVPPINTNVPLPVESGLVARYDGPSWSTSLQSWIDRSGNGNNTSPSDVRGTINYDVTNGFLYGNIQAGIRLPAGLVTQDYTLIHLAKYNNGVKQRIFQGVTTDWASGFYQGKAGVAYHNGYITPAVDLYGYQWVVSSDQSSLYRAQSVDFTSGTPGTPSYDRIGLNYGFKTGEYSDWAVAEVLLYNRKLSATEMASVETYLRSKYPCLTILIDTTTGATFTVPQTNLSSSVGTIAWSYKTPLPTGVTFTGSAQSGATFAIATGTYLNNQTMFVTASGNGGAGTKSITLLACSRAILNTPKVTFNSTNPGTFTVLQTATGTGTITWAYSTLPTGVTFLSSSDSGITFSVAQNAVVPLQNFTVTATNIVGTPTVATFQLGAGVKPILAVGAVSQIDSTTQQPFTIPQTVIDALTGGITWTYGKSPNYDPFPTGLTVATTNQGAVFAVAQNSVIAQQSIVIKATNIGGVETVLTFTVGAAVKPVLVSSNQLLDTSGESKPFSVTATTLSTTYSGGIAWSYILPTNVAFVSSSTDGSGRAIITFQVARGLIVPSQSFAVTATNSVGTPTTATFTIGAGTQPTLSGPTPSNTVTFTGSISGTTLTVTSVATGSVNTGAVLQIATPTTIVTQLTGTAGGIGTYTIDVSQTVASQTIVAVYETILDTTSQNVSFTVKQDSTKTGTITWTVSPSSYPAGVTIPSGGQTDQGITFILTQSAVLPYQIFTFTATAASGWTATRRLNIGASTLVQLQSPGDPQLLDTTTQRTITVTQLYDPAYTGPVTWTLTPSTFPAGISVTTQTDRETIITLTPNSYLARTKYTFKARSAGGLQSTVYFDIAAAVRPVLTSPGNQVLNTAIIPRTFTVTQDINTAYTGTINWTLTPTTLPGGTTTAKYDNKIDITVPAQPTGVIFPDTPFTVTAQNANTGLSSIAAAFNVFVPRLPSVNAVTPSARIIDVSTAAYTAITVTQSATDAIPVVWSITKWDGSSVPAGVSINSSTGQITFASTTYLTATDFKATATNPANASASSAKFTVATPEPPAISSTPASPQILNVTGGQQQLTFTLTNSALAGNISWSFGTFTPPSGVTITTAGLLTIPRDTYFASTVFTIRATNTDTTVYRERMITINTPQTPVVNTAAPTSPQKLNVTATQKQLTFTNTVTLANPVVWTVSLYPSGAVPVGVSIDESTGVLTISSGTYFLATNFAVTASNAAIGVSNTRGPFNINTPAPPVISAGTVSPAWLDVRTASKTVSFTNTETKAAPVSWSINPTAGITAATAGTIPNISYNVTVPVGGYFIGNSYDVAASNTAVTPNITTTLSSYVINAPAPPVLTGPWKTTTGTTGSAIIPSSGTVYYVDNTASNTVYVRQTSSSTGTIVWTGLSSPPTGVSVSTTDTLATITIGTSAGLRPLSGTTFNITATGPAPLSFTNSLTAFSIFTPLKPVLGTPSPAPSGGLIILDTYASGQNISVTASTTYANMGPATWGYGGAAAGDLTKGQIQTFSTLTEVAGNATPTLASTTIAIPQTKYVIDTVSPYSVSISLYATNLAGMKSDYTSFRLWVPYYPVFSTTPSTLTAPAATNNVDLDTTSAASYTLYQITPATANGISNYTSTSGSVSVPTPSNTGQDAFTYSVAAGTIISTALTVTISARNGANRTISSTFYVRAAPKPVITSVKYGTLTSPFVVDTTSQQTLAVVYTSSGINISSLDFTTTSYFFTNKPSTPITSSPFNLTIAKDADFAETNTDFYITTFGKSDSFPFTITACVKPVLGSPSTTGVLDTTTQQTVTIAQTSNNKNYSWASLLPTGASGAGSGTLGSTDVYTITVPAGTTFSNTKVTVTATPRATSLATTQEFYLGAVVKPVVNSIGTQTLDTTSTATGPTASVTSASTMNTAGYPITWSVSGGTGVSIDGSTGVISVAASSFNNGVTITVTATNGAGSGNTTFTLNSAVRPVLNGIGTAGPYDVTSGGVTVATATLSSGSTPVSWSISGASGISIDSGSGVISIPARYIIGVSTITVTATNAFFSGSTSFTLNRSYVRYTSTTTFVAAQTGAVTGIIVGGGGPGGGGSKVVSGFSPGFFGPIPSISGGGAGGGGGSGNVRVTTINLSASTSYPITIGGAGGTTTISGPFGGISATGGSTGGGGGNTGGAGGASAGGFAGGTNPGWSNAGGGGGSGGVGGNAAGPTGGSGGNGTSTVFGNLGGGGGGGNSGTGIAGGGNGGAGATPGNPGSNGGGGGGGGTGNYVTGTTGGVGGSGIVYLYL